MTPFKLFKLLIKLPLFMLFQIYTLATLPIVMLLTLGGWPDFGYGGAPTPQTFKEWIKIWGKHTFVSPYNLFFQ